MTRREALKVIGGGAALMGMGALTAGRAAENPGGAVEQPFTLPKLAYGYDALEPHFDARTMEIHYTKHHAAYIKNANKALEGHPELLSKTGEEILAGLPDVDEPLRTTLRNNVGGHVNHSFFWRIIAPAAPMGERTGNLAASIDKTFGSSDAFKTQFAAAAMKVFGSGWAWLSVKDGALSVQTTPNQDSLLSAGATPVIGLDVWEHAYYLKHQNVRADYVAAFWNVLNWQQADANYAAAVPA